MNDGVIEGNIAGSNGGGVAVTGRGIFTMNDGLIRSNQAAGINAQGNGGGVHISTTGIPSIGSEFNMNGGIIGGSNPSDANTATRGGGVSISGEGTFTMQDGMLQGNQANDGGGIFISTSSFAMAVIENGHIRNNHAINNGGGIYSQFANNYQNHMMPSLYSNINISPAVHFLGNTAGNGAFNPPTNALAIMPLTATISISTHQLNNYDINFAYEPNRIQTGTFQVWNYTELLETVQYIADQGFTEQVTITVMQDFGTPVSNISQITIPAGSDVLLTSYGGNVFTYTITNTGRHFDVRGKLTLQDVVLSSSGSGSFNRGGVNIFNNGHFVMETGSAIKNNAGAVFIGIDGTFTMYGGIIKENTADSGGGILIANRGTFIMRGGVIQNNMARMNGGGVSANSGSTFIMHDGIIQGNTAVRGGGVNVEGNFTMHGGIIRNNKATGTSATDGGGGVRADVNGRFRMYGGIIDSNTAQHGGGVLINSSATIFMDGPRETTVISNNEAFVRGGGIDIRGTNVSNLTSGAITNNRAGIGGGVSIFIMPLSAHNIRNGVTICSNQAQYGGGIWINDGEAAIFGNRRLLNLQGGQIRNNHAMQDGGGIFTERGSNYQNPMPLDAYVTLTVMPAVHFFGNTAGNGAFNPPSNALNIMPLAASISTSTHQLNNYDINFAFEPNRIWNTLYTIIFDEGKYSLFEENKLEEVDFENESEEEEMEYELKYETKKEKITKEKKIKG